MDAAHRAGRPAAAEDFPGWIGVERKAFEGCDRHERDFFPRFDFGGRDLATLAELAVRRQALILKGESFKGQGLELGAGCEIRGNSGDEMGS